MAYWISQKRRVGQAQRNLGFICIFMTVETKFNIRDTVWYIYNNKICSSMISSIRVGIKEYGTSVIYCVPTLNGSIDLEEKLIFSSKEELIKSL